jgi:hypothetical protein
LLLARQRAVLNQKTPGIDDEDIQAMQAAETVVLAAGGQQS